MFIAAYLAASLVISILFGIIARRGGAHSS